MPLTPRQRDLYGWCGFIGWCVLLTAIVELRQDDRARAEIKRRQELEAAAQAGAIAATIINAAVDDLEAADCSDVLDLCPDPTRHEPTTGAASC